MSTRIVAAAMFAALASVANADQVTPAEASLSPLVYQDENGYSGCGLRVIIVSVSLGEVRGGEFALTLFTRPTIGGLGKAGGVRCAAPCNKKQDLKYIHGSDFQISTVKDGVPAKILKTGPAEEPVFTLLILDAIQTTDLLMKLRTGERMQYSFKPDGSSYRETYSFVATPLSQDEATSFDACLDGALKE